MKRFFAVVSTVLFVFALVSCGNISLSVNGGNKAQTAQTATGRIVISMPALNERTAQAIKQTVDQITSIDIMLDNSEVPADSKSKINATCDELEAGIAFVVNPGTYTITIKAYKGSYSEGTRVILYEGKTGNSDPAVVAAGDTVSKTISMEKYFILYDNGPEAGDNRFILEGSFLYSSTSLESVYVPYDGFEYDWMVPGKVIAGWKDPEGNEYERGQEIPLGGKQLPLVLTAIWADPTVTYRFNGNVETLTSDGSSMTTFSKEGERYSSFYVPAFRKEEIPNCAEDADETYRRGVFNDNNMTQNADESWQRDFDGGPYYFCGWSVNEKIDTIETINIESLREKLQSVEIVQPGQEISLKYDDTVFYAVWANAALADSGEIWKISYELGESEPETFAKKYMYCLKDSLKDDPYYSGKKKAIAPALMGLFPQIREYGSINTYNYWYKLNDNDEIIDDDFVGQGGDFDIDSNDNFKFRYKVDIYSLVLLRDASDENEYSPSWDIIYEKRTHAYPVDLTGITLPTYAQIKAEYPASHDGEPMPEPDDGTVFIKWLWMDSDRENNPWGLTEPTYLEDGHTFTSAEVALVKNSGMELPLVAVYGDPMINFRYDANFVDTIYYAYTDIQHSMQVTTVTFGTTGTIENPYTSDTWCIPSANKADVTGYVAAGPDSYITLEEFSYYSGSGENPPKLSANVMVYTKQGDGSYTSTTKATGVEILAITEHGLYMKENGSAGRFLFTAAGLQDYLANDYSKSNQLITDIIALPSISEDDSGEQISEAIANWNWN